MCVCAFLSCCDGSSDRSLMVDPLSYFSFQPVLHDWCNKRCGMCYPRKCSLCGGSGFPLSLSKWSFTICFCSHSLLRKCLNEVRAFAHGAMGHQIDPSWGGPIALFLVPASGICYPVCGMMHIKEPLLLIGKSSPCGGSGFPLSLSEWFSTICPTPYTHK